MDNKYKALCNDYLIQTAVIEQHSLWLKEKNMYTLQQIKDIYYYELATGQTERRGLEQYIKEEFIPCYDDELNFMGYDKQ